MELWARKALECCEQSLMGCSSGGLESQNGERNVDSGGLAPELLLGMRTRTGLEAVVPAWQRIWLYSACVLRT